MMDDAMVMVVTRRCLLDGHVLLPGDTVHYDGVNANVRIVRRLDGAPALSRQVAALIDAEAIHVMHVASSSPHFPRVAPDIAPSPHHAPAADARSPQRTGLRLA